MSIGQGESSTNQARHPYVDERVTVGFFTDPTLCIGCKACEVACKEWNQVPARDYLFTGDSYDNTGSLGERAWRHVQFLELDESDGLAADGGSPWLFLSQVCKHCEVAGCLEHCPTGAIVRAENGAVVVQDDVCNGCGYCVVGCPFGVVDVRPKELPQGGGAFKCTFCYDRQKAGFVPACAKTCPTESIRFGPLDELRREAADRARALEARGVRDVHVYDPRDTTVAGTHALFLLIGDEHRYALPRHPLVPTATLKGTWTSACATAAGMLALTLLAFLWL